MIYSSMIAQKTDSITTHVTYVQLLMEQFRVEPQAE